MIILAINNKRVLGLLKDKYLDDVYENDITSMEKAIEYISNNSEDEDIVITKDTLDGDMSKEIYIKQIRLANEKCKVILLTEKLDEPYRKFLYANNIFNIIEGDRIDIKRITECIEEENKVVFQKSEMSNISRVLPKHFIAVYGTSGSGKSYIASNLARILSKDIGMKVAMVDMDLQNPAIDIYNNLNGIGNVLSNIVEDIDKGIDINDILDSRVGGVCENEVSYITNNSSIYECQNKLNSFYYEKIYAALSNRYDSLIVDLPASPFIDAVQYSLSVASKIYFVVNPNYISIRQAGKYLDLMTKLWGISKSNIVIVINKMQKNSLDKYQIESFFSDYKIIDYVSYNSNVEGFVNGVNFHMDYGLDKNLVYQDLGVVEIKNKSKNFVSMLLERRQL
ncbi:MAG: hypothetical protein IJ809_00810 [Clostridia bacterium]|nr:hypothetical protein [Clostridia bacterium]